MITAPYLVSEKTAEQQINEKQVLFPNNVFTVHFVAKKKEKEERKKYSDHRDVISKTPSRKHDKYKIKYTAMSQYISAPLKKIYIEFFSCVICSVP